jgi:hypothetical protein
MEYKYSITIKASLGDYSTVDYHVAADSVKEVQEQLNELYNTISPDKVKKKALQAKHLADQAKKENLTF